MKNSYISLRLKLSNNACDIMGLEMFMQLWNKKFGPIEGVINGIASLIHSMYE